MGCIKKFINNRIIQKILSIYIVGLLILVSFIGLIPIVSAVGTDIITTYVSDGGILNIVTEFEINESVFVNITLDNITGDPPTLDPPYFVKAKNVNSGDWINVDVMDNNVMGPWGSDNIPNDGKYWGDFNLSNTEATINASGPDEIAILQVNIGDTVNISEILGNILDNDVDIGYQEITIIESSGPAPVGNGTVKGFVENDTGVPILGATVHLNGTQHYLMQTDASG